MPEPKEKPTELNAAMVRELHPHYTRMQAEMHLVAHKAAKGLRDLVDDENPQRLNIMAAINAAVTTIAMTAGQSK